MSDDNVQDNEMDRLLQGAFESRLRGGGSSPSMVDVRHRARRHQRRRVGGVVGATAMLGVSGVAVLASRGTSETGIAGDQATTTWAMTEAGEMCGYTQVLETTTVILAEATSTIPWLGGTTALSEPTTTPPLSPPTTLYPEGCTPSGQYRCWGNLGTDDQGYTYFEICDEIAREQSPYPYPATTSFEMVAPSPTLAPLSPGQFVVVDATGEGGVAATDAMQRFGLLVPETDVVIIPSSRVEQRTMLISLGDQTGVAAQSASQLFGIDTFDAWDPEVILRDLPDKATVVLVVGRDYWDQVAPVPMTTTTYPGNIATTTTQTVTP